ncbi:MAG: hypothetical protein ACE5JT_01440 [Nitrosopumilaceae archaeon]
MQEIVLVLGSVAGACTAVVVGKFPRNKNKGFVDTNSKIKDQIESLKIEKGILTKIISRLYQKSEFSEIQRDKLLLRYQYQLGLVICKIEKLEAATKYPDLGPLSDGLMTLLDQKLSKLDIRLHELSSKIVAANETSKVKLAKESLKDVKAVEETKMKNAEKELQVQKKSDIYEQLTPTEVKSIQPHRSVEITTLTELPTTMSGIPVKEIERTFVKKPIVEEVIEQSRSEPPEKAEIVQSITKSTLERPETNTARPELVTTPVKKPKIALNIPDDDTDDDNDDLAKIKSEIAKTLSRLEQAEVD